MARHDMHSVEGRWSGALTVEPGRLTFTGAIGSSPLHAHACVQVLMVTAGEVVLADVYGGEATTRGEAVIPAGVRHEVRASPGARGVSTYVEPSASAGRTLAVRLAAADLPLDRAAGWLAFAALVEQRSPQAPLHPRLARALRMGAQRSGGPPELTELAAAVGISPSRLGHLFADQLGLAYPAWRRWMCLRRAVEAVRTGDTLTDAAHEAGFADSAHLSRTCRAMFGLTPTEAMRAAGWRDQGSGSVQANAGITRRL
ncbi:MULTISPECIES: AraC family transcriptional regulator [Streptomyces]|uniref:AraC family transcriptional regulator n=1 Tax=Streptomyces TaxID=1883 RepID=UPI0021B26006|nr:MULTISPECIES: AraC family transcriptional regulator [Streptomyces]MCT7350698.1 AraC family transcriptional regulator [Streptomyces sp. 15-116A]MCX4624487.1 AraC family transcriptional regulator [Streptomyces viridodiastaticus]